MTQRWPQLLPENRAVIFTSHTSIGDYDSANIDAVAIKTGERRTLVRGGFAGQYIQSGHLVYLHQGTLFAAPFDLGTLAVTGPAASIADNVYNNGTTSGVFAVSRSGLAIYLEGTGVSRSAIFSIDESGRKELLYTSPGIVLAPRFSPTASVWLSRRTVPAGRTSG
jgi:eukaryotic-like serine/threonine-protein kinase